MIIIIIKLTNTRAPPLFLYKKMHLKLKQKKNHQFKNSSPSSHRLKGSLVISHKT
ncbi:hypothetical protein Hanom_Chr11g00985061 [Helianthus anomalus]